MEQAVLDSHQQGALFAELLEMAEISKTFSIVKGTDAKFGVDGDQYFYGFGELPEPTAIYGFGKTPREALDNFQKAYYSQRVINPLQ